MPVSFLLEKGFGPQIGLRSIVPVSGTNYERMTNPEFAGEFVNRDETVAEADKYRMELRDAAIEVSRMYGPEGDYSIPGMIVFENPRGGRIGVIPQNGSAGDIQLVDFRGWKRQYVLHRMLEWINRGAIPLFVENAPNILPLRKDGEKSTVIGIANLSGDPLENVTFRLGTPHHYSSEIVVLNEGGILKSPMVEISKRRDSLSLRSEVSIRPMEMACFRLT